MTSDVPGAPSLVPPPGPLVVILTGPSGVGKDAVLERMRRPDASRHFVITATTRPPREGERDGEHYHFFTVERFEELRRQGQFLESASVYGNLYGVPRWEIAGPLSTGADVLMRTDVQGAATLRSAVPGSLVVFIAPESLESLRDRLLEMARDHADSIAKRIAFAEEECSRIPAFDYVVVNREGCLDQTVATVEAIITAERARTRPRRPRLDG
ncbi:MAG: guanylate kinase [Chloroflexi bacterium]|nr:guanylate kinase [Chloroflexota bacterium]